MKHYLLEFDAEAKTKYNKIWRGGKKYDIFVDAVEKIGASIIYADDDEGRNSFSVEFHLRDGTPMRANFHGSDSSMSIAVDDQEADYGDEFDINVPINANAGKAIQALGDKFKKFKSSQKGKKAISNASQRKAQEKLESDKWIMDNYFSQIKKQAKVDKISGRALIVFAEKIQKLAKSITKKKDPSIIFI